MNKVLPLTLVALLSFQTPRWVNQALTSYKVEKVVENKELIEANKKTIEELSSKDYEFHDDGLERLTKSYVKLRTKLKRKGVNVEDEEHMIDQKFGILEDYFVIKDVVCKDSMGVAEHYDKLRINRKIIEGSLLSGIEQFNDKNYFVPSAALTGEILDTLRDYSQLPEVESFLQAYSGKQLTNTIVDWAEGRLVHYPSKRDFNYTRRINDLLPRRAYSLPLARFLKHKESHIPDGLWDFFRAEARFEVHMEKVRKTEHIVGPERYNNDRVIGFVNNVVDNHKFLNMIISGEYYDIKSHILWSEYFYGREIDVVYFENGNLVMNESTHTRGKMMGVNNG